MFCQYSSMIADEKEEKARLALVKLATNGQIELAKTLCVLSPELIIRKIEEYFGNTAK